LRPFYYFFHGWAALDWFRGYDRTFLITPPEQRYIKKTFISPNRIIGGERSHRVLALYWMQKLGLMHNHISAPRTCPVENKDIKDIAYPYRHHWQDIESVVSSMDLPRLFPEEDTQRMSSCWLDQFDICAESMIYHVSETVFFGRRQHLTEKTFKPIALGMPFVLSAPTGSLQYIKQYGFKTFDTVWDESYDNVNSGLGRTHLLSELLKQLDNQTEQQKNDMFKKCLPIIEHNWNHFYGGGFEQILWQELQDMLRGLQTQSLS
jgi:hypothetical protein